MPILARVNRAPYRARGRNKLPSSGRCEQILLSGRSSTFTAVLHSKLGQRAARNRYQSKTLSNWEAAKTETADQIGNKEILARLARKNRKRRFALVRPYRRIYRRVFAEARPSSHVETAEISRFPGRCARTPTDAIVNAPVLSAMPDVLD